MKLALKYPSIVVGITFIIALLINGLFLNQSDNNFFVILSAVPEFIVNGLRSLSLSSNLNNILAWMLFLGIVFTPALGGLYLYTKDNTNKIILALSILFSIILAFILYGLLNDWFVNSILVDYEMYHHIINSLVTVIIVVLITALWIVYVLQHIDDKLQIIHNFQIILLLSAVVLTIWLAFGLTAGFNMQNQETNQSLFIWFSLIEFIPKIMMVILFIKSIEILQIMKQDLFDQTILPYLRSIKKLSVWIVLLSLLIPITLSLTQIILIKYINHINIILTIPWIELSTAFVLLLMSEIMIQSIAVAKENKEFI